MSRRRRVNKVFSERTSYEQQQINILTGSKNKWMWHSRGLSVYNKGMRKAQVLRAHIQETGQITERQGYQNERHDFEEI